MSAGAVADAGRSPLAALRAFRRDPLGLLEELAELGDVVRLRIPRGTAFLLNHPDLVHDVLVAGHRSFHKGPTVEASKMLLGQSLLTSEGGHHRRQRRLIQPIFHHERIAGHAGAMVRHAEITAARWRPGEEFDVHADMAGLTLAVVAETLFGTSVDDEERAAVTRGLTQMLAMFDRVYSPSFRVLSRLPTPMMRRFRRIEGGLDAVIERMITERRRSPDGARDVLSSLLAARDEGAGMSDRQVRDEALTLFLAGHETTANALAWTWWLLAEHEAIEARLHAEVDAVLGDRTPSADDVDALTFTRAVVSESLRLRPPAWAMGRRAISDHHAGSVRIAAGAVVVVSPWLLHRDPRWWAEPLVFRPERWLDPPARPRLAYLPFGAGPRGCIGEPFALLEATLVLATIARRWRVRLVTPQTVEPRAVVTLRPRGGIRVVPERREPPAG